MNKNAQIKFASQALGCKTNQYEMDALNNEAAAAGFQVVPADEFADVYVLNSCTVTAEAGRKCRQMLRRYRKQNPDALIVCSGCHSELYDLGSLCDLAIGTVGRSHLLNKIKRKLEEKRNSNEKSGQVESLVFDRGNPLWSQYEELPGTAFPEETRAYLKIQDGCDNHCSYCATTMARGPARSRKVEAILCEAEKLVAAGYGELVLTGTNLNSYACDWRKDPEAPTLIDLLEDLNQIPGLIRLRLSSLDAAGIITDEFMRRYAKLDRACPHFHLSLQSGSDNILRSMRRRDTRSSFREAVGIIRKYLPEAGLSTDIIVGFPGETEQDFQDTLDFCEEMEFMRIHVFRFSRRENTAAYAMTDQVPGDVKRERAGRMHDMAETLARRAIDKRLGQSRSVLAEREDEQGRWHGYTEDYLPAIVEPDTLVSISRGDLLQVRLCEREDSFVIAAVSD
ncbi:MAG: tRNA (N(6)-L-threonylcarbamoyladenosine(37)-C(2))-methylthiotransferase MtaB [Eubacteriales bacterium]|nr:tRNA (N(6)-L-threonylcarbamoyladenosine(37)-C(2))-methylthiotransferase MtaB [Eubacteriales bacterium]